MELGKDLVAASATPLVLAILAEGDSYGYAIIKRVTELSGGHLQWTDGMLYMTASLDPSPLEEQIAQWRLYLRRRRAIHGPDVEELEGHLRDQIAVLSEAGLAGDEAFLIAVKRMGNLDALSREFAREHSERLWKQLVMAPEVEKPADTGRAEFLVALGLAVAAALAVKLPA